MTNKKNLILIIGSIIILISLIVILYIFRPIGALTKINYEKVNEMINNKESFVLCISSTKCSHCDSYKPKLETIAKKQNIIIYYIDINKETKDNQEKFKELVGYDNGTPLTIFIKDGKESTTANRISGDVSERKILEKFKINKIIK